MLTVMMYFLSSTSVASLLFVDNPVGAGYSYVDSDDAFTTDVSMIAADMMVLLTSFFNNPAGKNFQVCTTLKTF
jgi:carboxypeptidase C (cathepsin A)